MMRILNLCFAVLVMQILTVSAFAVEGKWANADEMQARLVSTVDSVAEGEESISVILEQRLSQGWHSYWKNPGESGLPPRLSWEGSSNVKDVKMHFPVPKRYDELGLTTFGYEGSVHFPIEVVLEEAGKPVVLSLRMDTMVCKDICIPQSLTMALDLKSGAGGMTPAKTMYEYAMNKVPSKEDTPNLKIENLVVGPNGVVATVYAKSGFSRADMFVVIGDFALPAKPEIKIMDDDNNAQMIVSAPEDVGDFLVFVKGKETTVTIGDGRKAVEKTLSY